MEKNNFRDQKRKQNGVWRKHEDANHRKKENEAKFKLRKAEKKSKKKKRIYIRTDFGEEQKNLKKENEMKPNSLKEGLRRRSSLQIKRKKKMTLKKTSWGTSKEKSEI